MFMGHVSFREGKSLEEALHVQKPHIASLWGNLFAWQSSLSGPVAEFWAEIDSLKRPALFDDRGWT